MARKVCFRGAGGLGQAGGTAPEQGRGCSTGLCPCCLCIVHAWGVQVLGGVQALTVPRQAPSTGGGSSLCQVLSGVGALQCAMLNEKLDSLVRELNEEAQAIMVPEEMAQATHADVKDQEKASSFNPSTMPRIFKSKEQLMLRANSLKKALRQIIEQTEKGEGVVGAGCFPDAAAT